MEDFLKMLAAFVLLCYASYWIIKETGEIANERRDEFERRQDKNNLEF